jgi:hypothetical protein
VRRLLYAQRCGYALGHHPNERLSRTRREAEGVRRHEHARVVEERMRSVGRLFVEDVDADVAEAAAFDVASRSSCDDTRPPRAVLKSISRGFACARSCGARGRA